MVVIQRGREGKLLKLTRGGKEWNVHPYINTDCEIISKLQMSLVSFLSKRETKILPVANETHRQTISKLDMKFPLSLLAAAFFEFSKDNEQNRIRINVRFYFSLRGCLRFSMFHFSKLAERLLIVLSQDLIGNSPYCLPC